jgi:peptidoglycan hydrolase-like protein with peptidoglycan-binding domain
MNNLLSFNPEPFETDSEFRGARRGYDLSNDDWGQEAEFASRRGRSRAPRPAAATVRRRQVYTKTPGPFDTGVSRPSAAPRKLPSHRRKPPFGRFGAFSVAVPEWPVFPITEREPGVEPSQEPEPPRYASEHVRWAQSCLNEVMGLRLATDGIMNAETRSAIRSFQQRRGMRIDGLVGPETERTLAQSCKERNPPPPATAAPAVGRRPSLSLAS